ncbi:hypothetical protein R5R35_009180 [Gryllus longicercus]|uniref:ETS domain-containing protein n=2 Tax=Gryllus longicercus TaxID=2509291 RepID=A0AAN9VKL1_9ORTH
MFLTAPGAYVDSTMPQSCYSGMWPEESQYHTQYPFYEWDEHNVYSATTLTRPMDEHKYVPPHELLDFDHHPLSAIGKSVPYASELVRRDTSKPMKDWEPEEVIQWFCEEARNSNVDFENIQLPQFSNVNGCKLQNMTLEEFTQKDYHYGKFLYDAVRRYMGREAAFLDDNLPPFNNLRPKDEVIYTDLSDSLGKPALSVIADNDSYNDSDASSHEPFETKPPVIAAKLPGPPGGRRPVGRPPKPTRTKRGNKEKKCGRLWEFIRDLLLKPEYCPSLICWENHEEGIFRFVRSDKVAELWGTIKENPKMTYEKLSRAMRYYYKSQVLQPVLGRRLVYKFGPTARGWRTNNPNFRDSTK